MENPKSNSIFIMKLIGSLFTGITLLLSALFFWMLLETKGSEPGSEYRLFIVATGILNAATATIAIFIWWIVSNKKKFLSYD
ncbi:MAG: hypothetical protein M3Q95_04990 [Bacteroidota bacterium]|nr:hypothetical protein [Bacteroidota bacterium]